MGYPIEPLIATAHDYWPSDREASLRPDQSPQFARLRQQWQRRLENMSPWEEFVESLQRELPGFLVGDITATVDASLRCAVSPRDGDEPSGASWMLVGCMSILAPVYILYVVRFEYQGRKRVGHELSFEPVPHELRPLAETISRKLEALFGVSALPREVAETPVPLFVDPHRPPDTTLFHALFTSEPKNLP